MLRKEDVEHKWYIIDAEGKTLGKVAALAASVLKGKNKPTYTPHVDCGDNIIIVNANQSFIMINNFNIGEWYSTTIQNQSSQTNIQIIKHNWISKFNF